MHKLISKSFIIILVLVFSSCSFSNSNKNKLKWYKINEIKKINVSGMQIANPPGKNWEFSTEYNNKKISRINFRNIDNSKLYSAFGHIRAIELVPEISNSVELKIYIDRFIRKVSVFSNGNLITGIGRSCLYNCARFKFRGIIKERNNSNIDFKFNAFGYFFQHPSKVVFEVMLSEKYPANGKSRFSSKELDSFFKSLRFDQS